MAFSAAAGTSMRRTAPRVLSIAGAAARWPDGAGGPDRVDAGGVPDLLLRLQCQTLLRADHGRGQVRVRLHLNQDPAAEGGPDQDGQAAILPSQEVAAAALTGHDAAPERLASAGSQDRDFDLIATMDDATSHFYSTFLVDEEGTMSTSPHRSAKKRLELPPTRAL